MEQRPPQCGHFNEAASGPYVLCREQPRGPIKPQESIAVLPKSARLEPSSRSAAKRSGKPMRKIVFKALTVVSTIGRGSKKHVDWTLAIAIFSTIFTLSLVALY